MRFFLKKRVTKLMVSVYKVELQKKQNNEIFKINFSTISNYKFV